MSPTEIFRKVSPTVVQINVMDNDFKPVGLGSGFFVSADGLLVTNYHVIEGAGFASVLRAEGSTFFVNHVLAYDKDRDLAVLRVNGTGLPLLELASGDADEYRIFLLQQMGDNTARRLLARAKQFFRAAVRKRLLPDSPFADITGCQVRGNPERFHFVDRQTAERVLEALPDTQWRLIFALARYGGLRCPSEILALRRCDVDWEHGRMTVRSSKTEHCEDRGTRVVPIFPELRPHLERAFDEAEPGTVWVVTRYRLANVNLRTQLAGNAEYDAADCGRLVPVGANATQDEAGQELTALVGNKRHHVTSQDSYPART